MSDYKKLKELLLSFKINIIELCEDNQKQIILTAQDEYFLLPEQRLKDFNSNGKIQNYSGFFCEYKFDCDENFISVGIYE